MSVRQVLFLLVLPLCLAYAVTARWILEHWLLADSYYSHGPLVPVLAIVFVYLRRRRWMGVPAQVDHRGFVLLCVGLLVHLVGAALMVDSLSAASLMLAVPGACWFAAGLPRMRSLWPVVFLLPFALPMPMAVSGDLSFTLKEFAVGGGLGLANALGLGAQRLGAEIAITGTQDRLLVADPCSGLRSLVALTMMGYVVAFFLGPVKGIRPIVLLLVAIPLAIGTNILRIAGICLLAGWKGVHFAAGTGHDLLNAAAWVVNLAVLLLLDAALTRRVKHVPPGPVVVPMPTLPVLRPWKLRHGLALWLGAVPLLILSAVRPYGEDQGLAQSLPVRFEGFHRSQELELNARHKELLGTEDAIWRVYREEGSSANDIYVVAVWHGSNWKSVHPPHICLRGSDMTIVSDGALKLALEDDEVTVGRILTRGNQNGMAYLSLFAFVADGLVTESYAAFAWHHLPKVLLRRHTSGCLLRVETWVGAEGEADAERRLVRFLGHMLPATRDLAR